MERLFTNTFWRADSMPRELFVPAVNERVGMNDRGRPSGSPLRNPRFCCADSLSVHRRVRARHGLGARGASPGVVRAEAWPRRWWATRGVAG